MDFIVKQLNVGNSFGNVPCSRLTLHMHKRYYKPRYLEACVTSEKACRFYAIDGTEPFLTNPHPSVIGWITDYPDKVITSQQRI